MICVKYAWKWCVGISFFFQDIEKKEPALHTCLRFGLKTGRSEYNASEQFTKLLDEQWNTSPYKNWRCSALADKSVKHYILSTEVATGSEL